MLLVCISTVLILQSKGLWICSMIFMYVLVNLFRYQSERQLELFQKRDAE